MVAETRMEGHTFRVDALGLLVVISAPSGTGKSTVIREVRQRHPEFRYSVSATTRPIRAGETDGISYHFLDVAEFKHRIAQGEFAEWAIYCGHYYGTLKSTVSANLRDRAVTLFDLDVQGARQMRAAFPEAVLVFLLPPTAESLRERLTNRGTETPQVAEGRLRTAQEELLAVGEYDYILINDRLADTVLCVEHIIAACRGHRDHLDLPVLQASLNIRQE